MLLRFLFIFQFMIFLGTGNSLAQNTEVREVLFGKYKFEWAFAAAKVSLLAEACNEQGLIDYKDYQLGRIGVKVALSGLGDEFREYVKAIAEDEQKISSGVFGGVKCDRVELFEWSKRFTQVTNEIEYFFD